MVRRLRIAVSLFFTVVAVALCVLWARSYWYLHILDFYVGRYNFGTGTVMGTVVAGGKLTFKSEWEFEFDGDEISEHDRNLTEESTTLGFGYIWDRDQKVVFLPIAVPALASASIAWFGWWGLPTWRFPRFSLRALLITISLVAVLLGLGVWAAS